MVEDREQKLKPEEKWIDRSSEAGNIVFYLGYQDFGFSGMIVYYSMAFFIASGLQFIYNR